MYPYCNLAKKKTNPREFSIGFNHIKKMAYGQYMEQKKLKIKYNLTVKDDVKYDPE